MIYTKNICPTIRLSV